MDEVTPSGRTRPCLPTDIPWRLILPGCTGQSSSEMLCATQGSKFIYIVRRSNLGQTSAATCFRLTWRSDRINDKSGHIPLGKVVLMMVAVSCKEIGQKAMHLQTL